MLTNKPLEASSRILETLGLSKFFRLRVGGDGPWPRKPSPEGLQFLMSEEAAGASDTVLVGDSPVDLATARNAGVRICLARYGFGLDGIPLDRLSPGDRVIDAPSELLML